MFDPMSMGLRRDPCERLRLSTLSAPLTTSWRLERTQQHEVRQENLRQARDRAARLEAVVVDRDKAIVLLEEMIAKASADFCQIDHETGFESQLLKVTAAREVACQAIDSIKADAAQHSAELGDMLRAAARDRDSFKNAAAEALAQSTKFSTDLSAWQDKSHEFEQQVNKLTSEKDEALRLLDMTRARCQLLVETSTTDQKIMSSQRHDLAKARSSLESAQMMAVGASQKNAAQRSRIGQLEEEKQIAEDELSLVKSELETVQSLAVVASEQRAADVLQIAKLQDENCRAVCELAQAKSELEAARVLVAVAEAQQATEHEQFKMFRENMRVVEVEKRVYSEHVSLGSTDAMLLQRVAELEVCVARLTWQLESKESKLGHQELMLAKTERLEFELQNAEVARRELHNMIQDLRGSIRICCRVRPCTDSQQAVQVLDGQRLMVEASNSCSDTERHTFTFDHICGPEATQADVFSEVQGLVQSALDGHKVCIFAYGQTGSGKTHTMQGSNEPGGWGLIPQSLQMIFKGIEAARAKGWNWTLQASIFEVYNETIRDLLRRKPLATASADVAGGPTSTKFDVKHDDCWGTIVPNADRIHVSTMAEISDLIAKAVQQRAVGSTDMNSASSRSHAVFAFYLRGVHEKNNVELHGALHLVDLAGSERLDKSGASGDRLKEAQNINRSLSSLADVFAAKAEGRAHVPFRNSKLTQLMEPCLSGQGKTLLLVNLDPSKSNAHETLCSLRFARQVAQCVTSEKPRRCATAVSSRTSQATLPSSRVAVDQRRKSIACYRANVPV